MSSIHDISGEQFVRVLKKCNVKTITLEQLLIIIATLEPTTVSLQNLILLLLHLSISEEVIIKIRDSQLKAKKKDEVTIT